MRFCLIHGSTQNSSGWKLLKSELESRRHQVICPDLPTGKPEAGGMYYAEFVAAALRELPDAPIMVGHSVSGLLLPLVETQRPVARMIFLGAAIPQIGKSTLQQLQSEPEMFYPEWIGKDPTKDPELAMKFLFHDCSPDVARWALTTLRLTYAHGALAEICPLDKWPDAPASYVVCAKDRTLNPAWCRKAAPGAAGA